MTDDINRRDVLRGLGGLALTGAVGCGKLGVGDPGERALDVDQALGGGTCAGATIAAVANRKIPVTNVEAYAQKSLSAGETIDFRVSSPVSYQLSVVRLGWDITSPSRDKTLHSFPPAPASPQFISPGSYVHVENALAPTSMLSQLTLECWVRPFRETTNGYWQGLISQHTNPVGGAGQCGFGLFLTGANVPCFYFGDGGTFHEPWFHVAPAPLDKLTWHHVVAVFDAGAAQLYVDGAPVFAAPVIAPPAVTPGPAPLRLGAYGDATGTSFFFDGDLAMPVIYSRALSGADIAGRFQQVHMNKKPPDVAVGPAVLGCWPLDEEQGAVVRDVSACGRPGMIVNRGTWMIGGPSFDASEVTRSQAYDPVADTTRGHGLRLSSKDFFDCAWPISKAGNIQLSYSLPSDSLPGVYVGRIVYDGAQRYDVTFVVRRAANRPCAPVLVLCSTTTWHAYNYVFGLFSFYNNHGYRYDEEGKPHDEGQPTYYQGIEMPWQGGYIADPYYVIDPDPFPVTIPPYEPHFQDLHYSPWVRAERFLHVWLEINGYDYDVISDRDLHLNPSILSSYQTVFIAGHSEYWSQDGWSAVRSYLAAGGHMIVASGNTMFWRVTYDDSVIECRKLGQGDGGERPHAQWGELYHEHDHRRGGLMREAGCPGWQAIALETRGYGSGFAPYKVKIPAHDFFRTPEAIALSVDTEIGGKLAVGHEWDSTVGRIPGAPFPLPSDYAPDVLAAAHGDVGYWNVSPLKYDCSHECDTHDPQNLCSSPVISEIADWRWASGGRVFAVGSVNAAKSLHENPEMATLFRNVLHHHGVVFRLSLMAIGQDGHFEVKRFDGSAWSTDWEDQGVPGVGFSSPPTGVQWGPNSLAAMAIATDGHFYYKVKVGSADSAWSAWNDFGGVFQGRPTAVGWGRNRLDLFARAGDHLWHGYWNGSEWNDEGPTWVGRWIDLGPGVASDPAALSWDGNRPSVAVRGTAGNIDYRHNVDGTWVRQDLGFVSGSPFAYAPAMVSFGGNRLAVLGVDASGHAWVKHSDGPTAAPSFTAWIDLGLGPLAGRVHVASWGLNGYSIFGVDLNGHLQWKWWDGATWAPSQTGWVDLGGSLIGEPAVVVYRGLHVSVFGVAPSGRVQHLLWNGAFWSSWQDLGGNMHHSPEVFRWVAT